MDKKNIFYKYADFTTLKSIGQGWVAELHGWIPVGEWLQKSSIYWVGLQGLLQSKIEIFGIHIWYIGYLPIWAVFLFFMIKFYIMVIVNWFVGKYGIKIGFYKARQQYGAKQEHLSPYEKEHRETIKNIAKAVGAKSEYTNL